MSSRSSGNAVAVLGVLATVAVLLLGVQFLRAYDDVSRTPVTTPGAGGPASTGSALPSSVPVNTPSDAPSPSPAPTPSEPSATPSPQSSEPVPPGNRLTQLLGQVQVVRSRPNPDGYDRDCGPGAGCVFGTEWNDDTNAPDGHNGCDTRNDVLRRDLTDVLIDPDTQGCVVRQGVLHDPYTGTTVQFLRGFSTSGEVQIDHLIPLAAAWDLGAWRWSPAKRATFANDTAHELLAVSGPANLAKSDSTPASWLPPNRAFRCEYGERYLSAALFWGLPITAADAEVLGHVARRCS